MIEKLAGWDRPRQLLDSCGFQRWSIRERLPCNRWVDVFVEKAIVMEVVDKKSSCDK
jgi:hypothetical protein